MKRKVYAKQIDKDKRNKTTANAALNNDPKVMPESQTTTSISATTSIAATTSTAAAASPRHRSPSTTSAVPMSRHTPTASLTGRLPNVNVLIKGPLRALQGGATFSNSDETLVTSVSAEPSFPRHPEKKEAVSSAGEDAVDSKLKDQGVGWQDERVVLAAEHGVSFNGISSSSFQTGSVYVDHGSLPTEVIVNASLYHGPKQRDDQVPGMKSMIDQNRGKLPPNDERRTFTEQNNVINQQREVHGITLTHDPQHVPIIMPTKEGSVYLQTIPDPVQMQQFQRLHQMRAWEQENYRYVDYPWRNQDNGSTDGIYERNDNDEVGVDDRYDDKGMPIDGGQYDDECEEALDINSNDESTNDSLVKQNGDNFSHSQKATSYATPHTFSGRRRRKRVQTPVQRSAANMRERRRMCHLNVAFDHLKEHLPNVKDKKKLSRIQTLKAAIFYIHLLQDSLNVC